MFQVIHPAGPSSMHLHPRQPFQSNPGCRPRYLTLALTAAFLAGALLASGPVGPCLWPTPKAQAEAVDPRDDGAAVDESELPDNDELEELRAAAAEGAAEDQARLGFVLLKFKDDDKDQEAFTLFEAAAEKRHPLSITMAAICYGDGRGVDKDIDQAIELLRRASNLGQSDAQHLLGMVLVQGRGVDKDPAAAMPWLRRSINQGNPNAMIFMSRCYIEGEGVEADPDAAFELATRAIETGSSRALMQLAHLHAAGHGTEPDLNRAMELLEQAEDNPWAQNNLAWLLATGPDPELHDGAKAVRIIRQALEELTSEDIWVATDTLAAALARAGDFAAAIETQESAIQQFEQWCADNIEEETGDDDEWTIDRRERVQEAAGRLQQRLAFYQSGKAVRQDPATEEIEADEVREQPADEAPAPEERPEERPEESPDDEAEMVEPVEEAEPPPLRRPSRPRRDHEADEDGIPSKLRNFPRDPVPLEEDHRDSEDRQPPRILISL